GGWRRLAERVDTMLANQFAQHSFILIAIHKHGNTHEFPNAVPDEAERVAKLPILPGTGGGTSRRLVEWPTASDPTTAFGGPPPRSGEDLREDLTHIPIVAIDPADARDHDDAVWAASDDDPANAGGWKAIVAIADVSFYVRP